MANRLLTLDEVAADLWASLQKAVAETGATPEDAADALEELGAWLGGFQPSKVEKSRPGHGEGR